MRTTTRYETEPHLDHELLDDPVEDVAVVVAVPRVHAEVLHRLGALLREQLHVDVPHGGVQRGLLVQPNGEIRIIIF